MSASAPAPVPATDVANTQQTFNQGAATASQAGSNYNQNTAGGSLTYSQTGTGPGGVPLYTATTSLSPGQQANYNTLQTQAGNLLTNANYGGQDPSKVIGDATTGNTNAIIKSDTDYLNPLFTTQTNELDAKLRNQGLLPSGSSNPSDPNTWGPYEKAMNQLQQNQNQTVTGAIAQFEPAAYSQAVSNYELPLTTAAQELGQMPAIAGSVTGNLAPTTALNEAPANYTGAVAQQENIQEQQYAQQMAQQNAMINGVFSLAGAGLGAATGGSGLLSGLNGGNGASGFGGFLQSGTNPFNADGTRNPYYGSGT